MHVKRNDLNAKSRMKGDFHVRFRERLRVKFPWSTRQRTIRKLTTQRNNSLHYGSDAGAEMAATYHSVISTVKLHGSSVWNFIGTFFKKIVYNNRKVYQIIIEK
jgi:hypothetical protein